MASTLCFTCSKDLGKHFYKKVIHFLGTLSLSPRYMWPTIFITYNNLLNSLEYFVLSTYRKISFKCTLKLLERIDFLDFYARNLLIIEECLSISINSFSHSSIRFIHGLDVSGTMEIKRKK